MAAKGERIQKYLASAGHGSRRACEEIVREMRVTLNGHVAEIGDTVQPGDDVRLDGSRVRRNRPEYWKVYKPKGFLCTDSKSQAERRAVDLIPVRHGRLFSVGRLDRDMEGLVLFTNMGDVANRLTHPRYGMEKIYEVRFKGFLPDSVIAAAKKGVWLSDGATGPLSIRVKARGSKRTLLTVNLTKNLRRMIPRLFAKLEHPVERVKRIGVGPVRLRGLKEGEARRLDAREVKSLNSLFKIRS